MGVDFYANEIQFYDHLYPIWQALPDNYRGQFYVSEEVFNRVADPADLTIGSPTRRLCLVASLGAYNQTTGPVIFMEHGIGNTYSNTHPSYAGGRGKDRVVLFLNQHELTQEKNRTAYPNAKQAIIGTPKMDTVPIYPTKTFYDQSLPVVCISFHWNCQVCFETQTAYYHYKDCLAALANSHYYKLVLHGHPKDTAIWQRAANELNIPYIKDFAEVLRIADVYVNDNSSTMYEFMATNRPVLVLNAPWYRKKIRHGIRFWEYIPGPQVDEPNQLKNKILEILDGDIEYHTEWSQVRMNIAEKLYPYRGIAVKQAVKEITEYIDSL